MSDLPASSKPGVPGDRAAWRRALLLLAALLVALSLARVWKLDLDAPEVVVRGYTGQAHFRDEPAKAHEARNKAKWDRWSLSEADEYGFWRAQSPAWVWGEYAWFKAFGVGLVEARAFVVVHTVVALALLMWLALIRHGLPAAIAAGLLLGLNWAYLVYSRLALMEGALLCWLLVVTLAFAQLDRRPREAGRWTALAVVAMFIACTIKQTGLLLVPAFALALPLLALRAAGPGRSVDPEPRLRSRLRAGLRGRQGLLALLGVASLALALGLLILNPDYQQRLAFNAEHFTAADEQPVVATAAQTLLRGLFNHRLRLIYVRLAPVMMTLATLEFARVLVAVVLARRARKRGEPDPRGALAQLPDSLDWWMLAWLVLALLANLASPHRAIRFQLVMLPPAAWLGAALLARVWSHRYARPKLVASIRASIIAVALLCSAQTVQRLVRWTQADQRTAAQLGAQLEQLIGDRHAVVVGEYAAQAVFETNYWHFYVRPGQFNTSDEVIHALGITHLVVHGEDDFVEKLLRREQPELLVGREALGELSFRGQTLTVWELRSPGPGPGPQPAQP